VLSFALTDYVTSRPLATLRRAFHSMPLQDLIVATIGLFIGLVLSALAAIPLSLLPDLLGRVLPFVACLAFAYLGVTVALLRRKDFLALMPRWLRHSDAESPRPRVIVDTSAIIDGRIAEIGESGFLPGGLLVPKFVLSELQHIADSPDPLRRNRGRRGLDVLNPSRREARGPGGVFGAERA